MLSHLNFATAMKFDSDDTNDYCGLDSVPHVYDSGFNDFGPTLSIQLPFPVKDSSLSFSRTLSSLPMAEGSMMAGERMEMVSPVVSLSEDGFCTPLQDQLSPLTPLHSASDWLLPKQETKSFSPFDEKASAYSGDTYYAPRSSEIFNVSFDRFPAHSSPHPNFSTNPTSFTKSELHSNFHLSPSQTSDLPFSMPVALDKMHTTPAVVHHTRDLLIDPKRVQTTQTIAPDATFRSMMSSPLTSQIEPSTPLAGLRIRRNMLESSPLVDFTPRTLPSQRATLDGFSNSLSTECCQLDRNPVKCETGSESNLLSSEVRKGSKTLPANRVKKTAGSSGRQRMARSSTSRDYGVVLHNKYFCSYPNCFRPSTNYRKSFARQEHKKRHELSVHGAGAPYACRFCGRGFNRNDNLKQHLTTHGKRTPARRNEWVAVLDEKSQYYDPDFTGPITRDGYPIRGDVELLHCPEEGCIDVFHTKKALKEHEMKKDHRSDGAGMVPQIKPKCKAAPI